MAAIKDLVKNALDESRMLVLVVQVLLGFHYREVFEPGFDRLAPGFQYVKLASFSLLLAALAMLLTIPAFHRIVEKGEDTPAFHRLTTGFMDWLLLPLALGLGLDMLVSSHGILGLPGAILLGSASAGVAILLWYGLAFMHRRSKPMLTPSTGKGTPLKDKVIQVLTECRVVLPGTQALLGFQLITFMTESFEKISRPCQILHLIALCFIALSAVLLMTPAAYHRLAERGEDSASFHTLAGRLLIAAMIPLAFGIGLDFLLVVKKITHAWPTAVAAGAGATLLFLLLWLAFPWVARERSKRR